MERLCKRSEKYNKKNNLKCTWLQTIDNKLLCGQESNGRRLWQKCESNCPSAIEWYNDTLVFGNVNVYGVIPTSKCKKLDQDTLISLTSPFETLKAKPNRTLWCCTNIHIDKDGSVSTKDAICSELICRTLYQSPITEKNVVKFTTVISLSCVTVLLAFLAVIVYCIRKEKCERYLTTKNNKIVSDLYQNIHGRRSSHPRPEPNFQSVKKLPPLPDIVNYDSKKPYEQESVFDVVDSAGNEMEKKLYTGSIHNIDPALPLNEQHHVFSYLPKLEMSHRFFEVSNEILGAGNFGKVYKGEAIGLFYPDSKTTVAIKTINDGSSKNETESLLCEIKILSNISLHFNLVNMMGACTKSPTKMKDIWLLLEFCEHGNLKSFLRQNRRDFEKCFLNSNTYGKAQNRQLIKWAYDITKGMKYLSSKKILHGDLAARNILLSGGGGNDNRLIAKISDFGLSKNMYKKKYYKKIERRYVPWKWMGFEFLDSGKFELKSDVWSYGVVVWEIFSIGEDPYEGMGYDEVFKKLKEGYHLPCPKKVYNIKNWRASAFYEYIARRCFKLQPEDRSGFKEIVTYIQGILYDQEIRAYENDTHRYLRKCNLLLDDTTRRRLRSSNSSRGFSLNPPTSVPTKINMRSTNSEDKK